MASLELQLIGPMRVSRNGLDLELTGSRKVRALIAYLALASNLCGRSHLCDFLWDVADDPRGELRWCLSKIRLLLDEHRVSAQGDTIALDLSDAKVDALKILGAHQAGFETMTSDELKDLADLFTGDLLDGLVIERNPAFDTWVVSQRRRFRDIHVALLEHIVQALPRDEARLYLDRWIRIVPFDTRPHELLLASLAAEGRVREGDEHLAATIKLFSAEGFDGRQLREAWCAMRSHNADTTRPIPARPQQGTAPKPLVDPCAPVEPRRASIAVIPFDDMAGEIAPGGRGDGLVHDIIMRLAKLRSLKVIAQGTMFALKTRQHTTAEVAELLGADYVVNGSIHDLGGRVMVRVELSDARTAGIVWAEMFDHRTSDLLSLFEDIGMRVVLSIEREVESIESNRAMLKQPSSLDAWEAHHRGIWHMYRFTQPDNVQAQHYFQMATRLDPTFARAHAGVSFTHWQNAFQGWADRNSEIELAYRAASQSMMVDDRDPTARWSMGRALWLRGMHDESVSELQHSTVLSPNFALAYYCLAFIQAQTGDPQAAVIAADKSRELSPFDPLLFGMLASRALALVRLGRPDEAAEWAVKAALRPNAHAHILAIAALALSLAGRTDEALQHVRSIRQRHAEYSVNNFFGAFHIQAADKAIYQGGAKLIGLA